LLGTHERHTSSAVLFVSFWVDSASVCKATPMLYHRTNE
jgi:hypothetical protein